MSRGGIDNEALIAAITEPTRRRLLDLLLEHGESTATSLADSLPVTRQAVSKHLVVLDRAGLVEGRRSGRELRYAVNLDRLDRATVSLAELAAEWDRRLSRIKRLAERRTRGTQRADPTATRARSAAAARQD